MKLRSRRRQDVRRARADRAIDRRWQSYGAAWFAREFPSQVGDYVRGRSAEARARFAAARRAAS